MKILWITNILFPDICQYLGRKAPVTGGWMHSSAMALLDADKSLELYVAALYGGNELMVEKINNITYYCLPFKENQYQYNAALEPVWREINSHCQPDVVHIHGTEFSHGLAFINACGIANIVVSIQGLVGAYARYSLGGIDIISLKKYRTLYDYLRSPILQIPQNMFNQGLLENKYIKNIKHIIGRTDWDKDHVWAINPNIQYHFCNETLRSSFYTNNWSYDKCEPHSIFLSQAATPIKGIHKVIEALPFVLREFPDTKVYVSGADITQTKRWKDKLKFTTYGNYIFHLMKQRGLQDKFIFTGLLNEKDMVERYLQAHVFICPSSIENSPNSLGEAQLLGVPCIASYAGGIPNMIQDGESGLLYRFEEHEMLANRICAVFRYQDLAETISNGGRKAAVFRHNKGSNARRTLEIYSSILNTSKNEN